MMSLQNIIKGNTKNIKEDAEKNKEYKTTMTIKLLKMKKLWQNKLNT